MSQFAALSKSPPAPYVDAPLHLHDTVGDDNRVPLVDPQPLAGAEQCQLAPIKTNINLGMFMGGRF